MGEGEGHCYSPCDVVISEVLTILYSYPAHWYLPRVSFCICSRDWGASHTWRNLSEGSVTEMSQLCKLIRSWHPGNRQRPALGLLAWSLGSKVTCNHGGNVMSRSLVAMTDGARPPPGPLPEPFEGPQPSRRNQKSEPGPVTERPVRT